MIHFYVCMAYGNGGAMLAWGEARIICLADPNHYEDYGLLGDFIREFGATDSDHILVEGNIESAKDSYRLPPFSTDTWEDDATHALAGLIYDRLSKVDEMYKKLEYEQDAVWEASRKGKIPASVTTKRDAFETVLANLDEACYQVAVVERNRALVAHVLEVLECTKGKVFVIAGAGHWTKEVLDVLDDEAPCVVLEPLKRANLVRKKPGSGLLPEQRKDLKNRWLGLASITNR